MIRIQRLKRPLKTSGHPLEPNEKTKVKGIVLVNTNTFTVYVDRFTPRATKKGRKK